MGTEAKVGIFVVIGFILLLGLSTQLSTVRSMGQEGYHLRAKVKDATGLNNHAKVKMNGVDIGEVVSIALAGSQVELTLFIKKNVKVPKDSRVALQQESMLGSKMVNIEAGDSDTILRKDAELATATAMASFEQTSQKLSDAADAFNKLMDSTNNVLDEKRQDSLKAAIDDLADAVKDVKEIVADNKSLVHETLDKYKHLAEEFKQTGVKLNDWFPSFQDKADDLVDEYTRAGEGINELLGDNAEPLNKTLKSTEEFFTTGKEAFVKVDRFLSSLTESELHVSIYGYYMLKDQYTKNFAAITYIPEPSTYYFIKLVADDDYTQTDASGNFKPPSLHDSGVYRLTLLYGKRFSDLLARAGWIDSHGGVGFDYFMLSDSLVLSTEVYDFNAANDLRSTVAHMNFYARYRMLNHLDLYAGFDNVLNAESFNFFLGFGMSFEDDNLKFLLGSSGLSSGSRTK